MDTPERDRARLLKALLELGPRGRFLPTVDLLERLFPTAARVGGEGPPRQEALRFRSDPSLGFAAGDIRRTRVVRVPGGALEPPRHVVEVEATFLGLTGSSSPLPNHILEQVLQDDADDGLKRDFLDVFHHRLISLLYRGVARGSLPREHTARTTSVWIKRALTLGGIDAYDVPVARKVPTATVLQMLPLLVGRARGARALRTAIRHVLSPALGPGTTVDIVENVQGWLDIAPAERLALGRANHALGRTTHLGARAPERSGKFAIRVGPLRMADYRRFLPGGDQLPLLREAVQLMTRNAVDFDVQLVVGSDAAPAFTLSASSPGSLGRTTWLGGAVGERVVVVADAQRADPSTADPASPASAA